MKIKEQYQKQLKERTREYISKSTDLTKINELKKGNYIIKSHNEIDNCYAKTDKVFYYFPRKDFFKYKIEVLKLNNEYKKNKRTFLKQYNLLEVIKGDY